MASYRLKTIGSLILVAASIVLIVTAVYSGQASGRLSWETIPGQTGITISYSDRNYIGDTLFNYGTIANTVVAAVLLGFAVGILLIK